MSFRRTRGNKGGEKEAGRESCCEKLANFDLGETNEASAPSLPETFGAIETHLSPLVQKMRIPNSDHVCGRNSLFSLELELVQGREGKLSCMVAREDTIFLGGI